MSKRVLVIDGSVDIRRQLAAGLSDAGFDVHSCRDGISAIHELEHSHSVSRHFDYIVLDVSLSDIAGNKILKVLKGAWPDLPSVVLFDPGKKESEPDISEYSNACVLAKPVELGTLVESLDALDTTETTEKHKHLAKGSVSPEAKAIVALKVTPDADRGAAVKSLNSIKGVNRVQSVTGEMDLIACCWRQTKGELGETLASLGQVPGIEVLKVNNVVPAKLDMDVAHFIEDYNYALEKTVEDSGPPLGPYSYIMVDIDPAAMQAVFTKIYFIDQVLECDVTGGGNRIIAYACEASSKKYSTAVTEISDMEGVLRVRELLVAGGDE